MEQKFTVVLIEDDIQMRKTLTRWLKFNFSSLTVVAESGSVSGGIAAIQTYKPDLVLIDMKLTDGTGIDVLRAFPDHDVEFAHIVLSGHDEFMQSMWEFAPNGYVLKPFDDDKLVKAINYALRKMTILKDFNDNKLLKNKDLEGNMGGVEQQFIQLIVSIL